MFRDVDDDRTPDLYVCSDFVYWRDRFWINEAGHFFRAIPKTAVRNMSVSSMAVDFGDINRDGHEDLILADMVSRRHDWRRRQKADMRRGIISFPLEDPEHRPEVIRNTLHLSRGDGTFVEIAQLSGVQWTEWSWSVVFLDVDLDGFEDLLVANGNAHDAQDADVQMFNNRHRGPWSSEAQTAGWERYPSLHTANVALRNRGDLTFEDRSEAWGFDWVGVSQGMALGDLDNDGDQDVVLNNLNGPAIVMRNDSPAPRIGVRLRGRPPNTRGIGAKIRVIGGPVFQSQEMQAGGRYLSSDDPMRSFAARTNEEAMQIQVDWRDGTRSVVSNALPSRIYEIAQSAALTSLVRKPEPASADPWFEDVTRALGHQHVDPAFDDFQRQPTLHHRLSHLGPGLAWFDLDDDGLEDLIIGAGRASPMAAFRNQGRGDFTSLREAPFFEPSSRDQTGLVGWASKTPVILAGLANWEDGNAKGSALSAFDLHAGTRAKLLDTQTSSPGPLCIGDVDGDGDLDLFVGGRVVPSRYPEPASSWLLENSGGRLEFNLALSEPFHRLGLVTSATFTDLTDDGRPELIIACEWGPVRVFHYENGELTDRTAAWGLDSYLGWWQGVAAGDLDGDGRPDLVAGNWGRNTRYQSFLHQPLRLYYGDLDDNGQFDLVEAYHDPTLNKIVPWREFWTLASAMPFIQEHSQTFASYGSSSVQELLGSRFERAAVLEATTLDSMVFLNRGDHFEAKPLPIEAQFAPAFAVVVADADGDGNEDIFLSQNFFGVDPDNSRYDGGRGLWLAGNGLGELHPVTGQRSGVRLYGEQRGAAVCDFDSDGRVDLAVTQNNGPTHLYRNRSAKPGLRVRINAGPENRLGIGAVLRLIVGGDLGPAREIAAGSGYWSQNATVQVLGSKTPPDGLWIRWPGGSESRHDIPAGAKEVHVTVGVSEREVLDPVITVLR